MLGLVKHYLESCNLKLRRNCALNFKLNPPEQRVSGFKVLKG